MWCSFGFRRTQRAPDPLQADTPPMDARRRICGAALAALATELLPVARAGSDPAWTQAASARWLAQQGLRMSLRGEGQLRWLGLAVYQARLWCAENFDPLRWDQHDFALELIYARSLSGARIAETSLELMQAQRAAREDVAARDATWLRLMRTSFPDVQAGDRILGLHGGSQTGCRFVHNLRQTGETSDAEFARAFFAIWLDPRTREPGLRKALLGLA